MKSLIVPPALRGTVVARILFSVALVALLVGVAMINGVGERVIAKRQLQIAETARDYFVAFAHEEGLQPLARALNRQEQSGAEQGFRYSLFGDDGELMGGANLFRLEEVSDTGVTQLQTKIDGHAKPFQVLLQPIAGGGTLAVTEDLGLRAGFHRALLTGSMLALVAAIAAVLLASLWLNRLMLRRAGSIERTTRQIVEGSLSARVRARPKGDVFDRLGESINVMLERNEELTTGLRTVTDSMAHDLRSPLTRMKNAMVVALEAKTQDDTREAIAAALEEADRALTTSAALLDIARAETGLSREMFEPVDLGALIADVGELFAPTLEDAGQSLRIEAPAQPVAIQAHEVLLRQALGNLLYNAARYAGDGAVVTVELEETPETVCLIVADTGPGVPEQDRDRVQSRFVRLDEARTSPGSGLGLAIVAACAKLHRGRLRIEDNQPGLRAVLEISR